PIDLAPVDFVFARRLFDDELVVRRATRMLARVHDERAVGAQQPFPPPDRLLYERRRRQVPKNPSHVRDPMVFDSIFALDRTEVLHTKVLQFWRGAFSTATRGNGKWQMSGKCGSTLATGQTRSEASRRGTGVPFSSRVSSHWTVLIVFV